MSENFKEWATGVADAIREKKGTTEKIKAKNFKSEILSISGGGGGEVYKGKYQIIPSVLEQILETKNRYLIDNVTVTQIPYHTVSNESGGNTVTIGETPTDKNGETILLSL